MDPIFLLAYNDTTSDEGCTLTVDPDDRGGLTWKGISYVMNPKWQGWTLVLEHIKAKHSLAIVKADQQLEQLVKMFYYNEFWLKLRIDKIKIQSIQIKFFNQAVNVGLSAATKFQQASVDLPQTGIVDNQLITALNS